MYMQSDIWFARYIWSKKFSSVNKKRIHLEILIFNFLPYNFIECMPGYIGLDCSSLCPYPYYGVDCQRTCNCSRNLCDVYTGCIRIVTGEHKKQIQSLKDVITGLGSILSKPFFQFVEIVIQDTLVKTVEPNAPILITVRNVRVNVTVMKTAVTFQLDVQMSLKVLYHINTVNLVFSYFEQSLFNMKHRTIFIWLIIVSLALQYNLLKHMLPWTNFLLCYYVILNKYF